MAKKKSSKKNSPSFLQWLLVAAAAFLLYKGLEFVLAERQPAPKKTASPAVRAKPKEKRATASPAPASTPAVSPSPHPTPVAVKKWNFRETARLLPGGSYPDNYVPIEVRGTELGILSHAKLVPGKKPGPNGLTNTRPAISWHKLDGGTYRMQELEFSPLKEALGAASFPKLSGLPQIETSPLVKGEKTLFVSKLFLGDDPREAVGIVEVDDAGIRWAATAGPDGKTRPAAFLTGTTRLSTRNFSTTTRNGKAYLIVEQGLLDEKRLHEGYRWDVSAYAWTGNSFVYDRGYSLDLTKKKASE